MLYTVTKVENKSQDWKIADLTAADGMNEVAVSINRTGKRGDVFPGFDGIVEGAQIEGILWKSSQNKNYLFPPKVSLGRKVNASASPTFIKEAQARKAQDIEKAQDRKSDSIAYFNALNSAIALLEAHSRSEGWVLKDDSATKEFLVRWREWFLTEYEKYKGGKDVPF